MGRASRRKHPAGGAGGGGGHGGGHGGGGGGGGGGGDDSGAGDGLDGATFAVLLQQAFDALDDGDGHGFDDVVVVTASACGADGARGRAAVTAVVERARAAVGRAWQAGWQPADLHRVAGRRLGPPEQRLVLDLVVDELAGHARATVDRRWWAQLDELEADVWWPTSQTWLDGHRVRGADWFSLLSQTLQVVHLLHRVPTLERLSPLPGEATPPGTDAGASGEGDGGEEVRSAGPPVDDRILTRVRMLLAKAESTTYPAEAETFTAGAQALMARHRIDAVLLQGADRPGGGTAGGPAGRRIGVDTPYDSPKAMLLHAVATANRCRTVWSSDLGFSTVMGFEADLDAVELLFTSLLVQATHTMTAAGSRSDGYGRSRTRSFRQSFLTGFAARIGERLTEVADAEEAAATERAAAGGRELVPLLQARAEEVDDLATQLFPQTQQSRVRPVRDAEGWHSGLAAADRASLDTRDRITG
ncbi:DUF2786 domain-containing protein [Terracoccus luteus]|uniref:DUF2786 domain-containing protein n=1 Tax=Terracoccus luteus TaxID=53356 RepID=A0A839PQR7_9MICO|nr:DUF2786 domain-containing protein [Terracoccus luteus]MBB2986530.1 hypothetical protein [Terracoccus luteus]MCP2171881.1 hypothetical protein [Terracoccus luteus]